MSGRYKAYGEYKDSGVEWLGEIPREWSVLMGKRIFSSIRKTALKDDVQLAVSQKYGVLPQSLMMLLNDSKVMLALKGTDSFRHVDQNDFVISLRSFEGGIEYSKYSGCVSPAYTVLNNVKKISHNYYKYLLKCAPFISALQSTTDSLRDGKSISYEQFGAICLPLTRLSEQNQIAAFLDHETAKIDTLIDKQQQLIELLKEKRQAVISHAVTKGLDPDVPMKDSGVEWLGEVPEHWTIKKSKYFFDFVTSGSRGWADYYSDDGPIFFRIANLTRESIDPKLISIQRVTVPHGSEGVRSKIQKNDILISITADLGSVCVADNSIYDGYVSQHISLCRPNELVKSSRWLAYCIISDSTKEQLLGVGYGGTKIQLSLEDIKEFILCFPPLDEQEFIASYLDKELLNFEKLDDIAQQQIELLKERRTALISAAVTGKIDVRDWQVPVTQTESDEVMA
ncbi:restriction endonuclease subunit S [Rahnella variigena]|uniref:Restriction endonuclease subunit S n=1 Tax=Rahnella variigena TaxID=574964 RepID=A0ABX9PZG6_9GAMM|nr:restriction endonuclease subunit S [Rahnella variigena]RJT51266.1 restriction endonuclease subunit S [Rahnella variigena]RKF70471.1 restriction endonuclease subunit S [Rahnella variigena]